MLRDAVFKRKREGEKRKKRRKRRKKREDSGFCKKVSDLLSSKSKPMRR